MKKVLFILFCLISIISQSQPWLLIGNAGTTNTNFIGTTDNVPLVFKVNNRFSGTIQNSTPSNTYFGYESGSANISTTGYWNVGVGCSALKSNTTGYVNTAIGLNSLFYNTTGTNNNAFGQNSLFNNISGSYNTAIGVQSMFTNTTGGMCIAIGNAALQNNNSNNNIAIGHQCGSSITTGKENSLIGSAAGYAITTGTNNACIGQQAGAGNSSGNSVLGVYALVQPGNTGGNNNVIGNLAMYKNTTGTNNCAFGREAMYYKAIGDRNISIGNRSLLNATSCSDNIVIGFESMLSSSAGSGNVVIGNYTLPTQSFSNTYWLDNGNNSVPLIYGNFSTRNIGLGNINPTEKLDVTGNIRFSGALMPNNTAGIAGQVLTSSGAGVAPTWKTPSGGAGSIASISPGTNIAIAGTSTPTVSVIPVPIFVGAGIGTGSVAPTQLLQLQGNSGNGNQLYINTTSGSPGMTLGSSTNINSATKQALFAMASNNYDFFGNSQSGDLIINDKSGKIIFGLGASSGTSGTPLVVMNNRGLSIGNGNINLPDATATLQATGIGTTNATYCLKLDNANGDSLLHITDGGNVTGVIASGTYYPALSDPTNISLMEVYKAATYMRIGQIVDAEYCFHVSTISSFKSTQFTIELPIRTSNPSSVKGEGMANSGSGDPYLSVGAGEVSTSNNLFSVSFTSGAPSQYTLHVHIQYAIY